jgi:hypothetical protein
MKNDIAKTEYGYEIVWANTNTYSGKILVFETAGAKLPLHFHQQRSKSWFVNAGKFRVQWVDTQDGKCYAKELPEGSTFHVPALLPTSLESLVPNSAIAETGTNQIANDIYRLN